MANIHVDLINTFFSNNKNKNNSCNNSCNNSANNCKMIQSDFFLENEIEICEIIIQKIPYYKCYFNSIEHFEAIHFGKVRNKNREKYEFINQEENTDKYFLVKYTHKINTNLTSYLLQFDTPKHFISELFFSYNLLINSLIKLNKYNICYFDLCSENIKCSDNNTLIIDNFRKSIIINKLNKTYLKKLLKQVYEYTYKPIEIHFIYYLLTNHIDFISKDEIKMLSVNFVNSIPIFTIYSDEFKEEYVRKSMHYLQQYVNKTSDYIIYDIIEYANTWDNYSLSVLYVHLVGNLVRVFSLKNTFFSKWLSLLTKNIHPDPSKRMTLEETLKKYENLYDEKNPDWSSIFITNNLHKEKMNKLYELLV